MDEAKTTIIPAEPGWKVYTIVPDGTSDGYELSYAPIVAWRVMEEDQHVWAEPITVSGVSIVWDHCIRQPDGRYVFEDEPFEATDDEILMALTTRREDRCRRAKEVTNG